MVVYVLQNKINGKLYVGQTQGTLAERWKDHIRSANGGSRFPVHCALRKYGPGAFLVCVVSEAASATELDLMEKFFIQKYNSLVPSGYNRTAGGDGFQGTHTKESREQMRRSHLGKMRTVRERKKQSATQTQLWQDAGYRKRNPLRRGLTNSILHRQRQSEAARKQWASRPGRAQ